MIARNASGKGTMPPRSWIIALPALGILPSTCCSSISAPTTFFPVTTSGSNVMISSFAPVPHAELLIRRGEWETTSGQPSQAARHLEEGLSLAARLGLPVLVSRAKAGIARALEAQGLLR